ncbi:MAG: hypothetical protein ACTS8Z_05295 [Candidatus Limnocylindrales bacterium]|jgi:hypothetical protein
MDPLSTAVEILLIAFAVGFVWLAWTEGRTAHQPFGATAAAPSIPALPQVYRPLIPRTIRQTPLA